MGAFSLKRILSIDPGVNDLGVAMYPLFKEDGPLQKPIRMCHFCSPSKYQWYNKCACLLTSLDITMAGISIAHVYCEGQRIYAGNAKGVSAADDVLHLAFCTGMIAYWAMSIKNAQFTYVPVDWKGQLKKQQLQKRIFHRFPELKKHKFPSHVWDAVGIGLHAQQKGFLND